VGTKGTSYTHEQVTTIVAASTIVVQSSIKRLLLSLFPEQATIGLSIDDFGYYSTTLRQYYGWYCILDYYY
jgi:hypothetical protein